MAVGQRRFFGDPTPIQKDYLVRDFKDDIAELPIVGSVHVQVGIADGDEERETAWLSVQNEAFGFPSVIVAFADLRHPEIELSLERQMSLGPVRGIRQIIGRSEAEDKSTGTEDLLSDEAFKRGLARLSEAGLSFDLQLRPSQMPTAAKLLERVPELKIAICHGGSLACPSSEGLAEWTSGMEQLAQVPGAICKVSGFAMFDHSWSPDSVRRQFDVILDLFGPDRMAFGSNFPVDRLYRSYHQTWDQFRKLTQSLSKDEVAALFHETANRFYRMGLPSLA